MSTIQRLGIGLLLLAFAVSIADLKGCDLPIPNPLTPKPIALDGFNVLVVTDTSEGSSVDNSVMMEPNVQSWLMANCDQWFRWDDSHTDFEYVSQAWRDAYQKALTDSNGVRPWVLISGNGGTSQQLPTKADEFIALLEKYK